MGHLLTRRSIGAGLVVLAVGVLASGCDWYGFGYGSQHNWDNALDTNITPANVSTLAAQFSATDGTAGPVSPQAVVNGILYAASHADGLEAYSANGTTGCSGAPEVCAPLWSYATGSLSNGIIVSSGVVYASTTSGLDAFDAAGQTNCSGTPIVCQPLWSASGNFGTPTVSNNTVYVTTPGKLEAFDAGGTTNCAGSPKVCAPIWTASQVGGTVTVSAGVAYAVSPTGVAAFDANGVQGCSGSPKVCSPLRQYTTNYPIYAANAVVSGTDLYVQTFYSPGPPPGPFYGDIEAFDADGKTGCTGSPVVCTPIWAQSAIDIINPLPVGDGSVFVSQPGTFGVGALDQRTGSPEWTSNISNGNLIAQAISGSVMYGSDSTNVYAYDASGNAGCSGTPKVCTSLWSAPGTEALPANGMVYVNTPESGEIVAYGLPS